MTFLNSAVTAFLLSAIPVMSLAQDGLDDLFDALQTAEAEAAEALVDKIADEWSKSGSASVDFLLDRGRSALEDGEAQLAVSHFSAAIDHAPDFAEGYNGRATAFYQMDRYGLALDDIRQVLSLNPRHFGAMTGLALILEQLDRPEAALLAWEEVIKLYPSSPQAEQAMPRVARQAEGRDL